MISEETPVERAGRLSKIREILKRMVSIGTPGERADRLFLMSETF